MRVLHLIPSLDPASGGPPVVAVRLAAAQAMSGAQATIISYRFPKAQANVRASLKSIPNFAAVQCEFLDPLTRRERILAANARQKVAGHIEQADMVHLHGVWDPLVYVAAGVCRRQGKPYVLTPHGMLHPWAMSQKTLKKRIALLFGYRLMLNEARFLHFLNADEKSEAARMRLRSKAEIIPNGIFLEEIEPLPSPGRFYAAHPELQNRPFILFLSRLHYVKGLDFLAGAFAIVARQLPDVQLVIAGPDAGARQAFVDQIQSLGLSERVHLVGPVYGPPKLEALVDAACFCQPSRQEGFSLAITEALARGAPVVISRACHFPEVAEANAGLAVELNSPAIAEGLLKLLGDPDEAHRMARAGREMVTTRFTWPIVASRMLEAYKTCLK